MNYFAHALPFLDESSRGEPYFAAATGVPDWLMVVDRRVRLKTRHVEPFLHDDDARTAAIAGGVWQHIHDDVWFHGSRAFAEVSLQLTVLARDVLDRESRDEERGFRPSFLGHLLTEVLLDATLIARYPQRLEAYYGVIDSIDTGFIESVVNRMAPRSTHRLGTLISEFSRQRVLSDYREDAKLMGRLNQVMRRVKCEPLPAEFTSILTKSRTLVDDRADELLEGTPTNVEASG